MIEDALEHLKDLFAFRQEAEKTLTDPGLLRAMADVRSAALESFQASAPKDSAVRENAYWTLRSMDGIEAALRNRIAEHENEKMVQDKMQERREQRDRAVRRVS